MFKTKCSILFQYSSEGSGQYKYNHTIETVWKLSFERIQTQNPAAIQILKACAFLQAENIPVCLFEQQHTVLGILSSLESFTNKQCNEQSHEVIQQAIAILVKFSFVRRTWKEIQNGEEDTLSDQLTIHRLVQKVIYGSMDNEQRMCWCASLLHSKTSYTLKMIKCMLLTLKGPWKYTFLIFFILSQY